MGGHGLEQPSLRRRGGVLNHPHAHGRFRQPLGDGQGDQRAGEPEEGGEDQQSVETAAAGGEPCIQAEQPGDDREDNDDREVGGEKQRNAFHGSADCTCSGGDAATLGTARQAFKYLIFQ